MDLQEILRLSLRNSGEDRNIFILIRQTSSATFLVATRSQNGSCVINAIHYRSAASLPILGKAVILRNIAIRNFSIKKLIPIYFSYLTKGGILFLQPKQMLKLPEIAQIGETGNQNMTTTGYVCHAKKNTVKYTHLTHFHIYHIMSVADVLLHQ